MYTIGEFSKINQITTKTLRHYDEIGLLKPAKTDKFTGYRFYTSEQLPLIHRILMLKNMGFSLKDIKSMLENNTLIYSLLEQRKSQLTNVINDEKKKLQSVTGFIEFLKGEKDMSSNIIIKQLPEVIVASYRTKIEKYNDLFDVVPKMGERMGEQNVICLEPAYCFNIYHDEEYKQENIDVEVCEAVIKMYDSKKDLIFKKIDGVEKAACYLHKGPYDDLKFAYNTLHSWINSNGYKIVGNLRESFIDGIWNKENEDDWLTELQIPIE